MSTTANGHHSGAGSLSLMSCVRESSPPQDSGPEYETEKNVSSKRKFWNPRKWFKRKCTKVTEEATIESNTTSPIGGGSTEALESRDSNLRSRSTSELSISEEQTRRRSTGTTPMHPGLSVSHDSIFHSPQSGSDLELDGAQSSSSLSVSHQPTQQNIRLQLGFFGGSMRLWGSSNHHHQQQSSETHGHHHHQKSFFRRLWTELNERLRLRRTRGDTSEDDEGLPRSPCNSPTVADGHHLDKSKDHPTKSHSTCSDGSLLSMGSSEMDEDSSIGGGQHSRHSSKLSLHEKRTSEEEIVSEWGPNQSASAAPLNHSAAHHKVAVRPKRTHGAPRRRRVAGPVLPTTPEVNEDTSGRSISPEDGNNTRETVTELYSRGRQMAVTDAKLKCSSLPPGLAGPGLDGNKLSRSRSNAGVVRSQDALEEEDCADGKKSESSFFGRIFPRRSGKKKKAKEQKEAVKEEVVKKVEVSSEPFEKNTIVVDGNLAIRPNALRSGPASRQRVQPIEIPVAAAEIQEEPSSPLHAELESHFKSKRVTQESPVLLSKSPSTTTTKVPWSQETRQYTKFTSTTTKYSEESKTKVRIAGLSSLQQRVLSLNEDDPETGFKSLTNLPTDFEKPAKPLAKSQSFKATKTSYENQAHITLNLRSEDKESLSFKSISLDSVQNEHVVESVNEAKVEVTESNDITITGPSHNKAIVNICAAAPPSEVKEQPQQQISVTKIHLKPATEEIVLEKPRKFSNDSIELEDEDVKRFSNEHIEIVKKDPMVTITPMATSRYKKHTESMKRALVVSEKPVLKVKSNSFEKPSEPRTPEETTKSQENLCSDYSQVIRRKSMIKPKQDEEPELMKVFARRSLKLKDVDSEALSQQVNQMIQDQSKTSRDSDKENCSDSSPLEERKRMSDSVEVTFRKNQHTNNKISSSTPIYQRAVSLHQPSVKTSEPKQILKQISVVERPKTETWISSTINNNNNNNGGGKTELKEQIDSSEIISNISEKKSDLNVISNNFNKRKAEWEKRAKEGIRKPVS